MGLQRISFSITGDKQYSRGFEALAHEVEDMTEPFEQIGTMLISHVHEQFRTEGASGANGKWKRLSKSYAAWKRDQVGEQQILVFVGTMRGAMIDKASAITISKKRFVYDPDVPEYANYHQKGDDGEGGGPPQRKMVDLPDTERRKWDRVFVEWIQAKRSII